MPSKKELDEALKKYPWLSNFLGAQAPTPAPEVKVAPKPTMEVVVPVGEKPYAQPIQGTLVPGPNGPIQVVPSDPNRAPITRPGQTGAWDAGQIDALLRRTGAVGPLGGSTRVPRKMSGR